MTQPVTLNIDLPDILTANSCSHLVVEFVKYIAYQRQQIPYPFTHLSAILAKRATLGALKLPGEGSVIKNVQSVRSVKIESEYMKAKEIFDLMESTFECIEQEFCFLNDEVAEVAIILGATPLSPRDVFRLQFPSVHHNHIVARHPHQRTVLQFFRCLIQSEDLHSMLTATASPTNLFIFIQKKGNNAATSWFIPKERYSLPRGGKHCVIKLCAPSVSQECICGGMNIHKDMIMYQSESAESPEMDEVTSSGSKDLFWFQAQKSLKGFSDTKVDGTSVSSLWLQS